MRRAGILLDDRGGEENEPLAEDAHANSDDLRGLWLAGPPLLPELQSEGHLGTGALAL